MVAVTVLVPQQGPNSHHETEFPNGTGSDTAAALSLRVLYLTARARLAAAH